jgi:hypothetical protein
LAQVLQVEGVRIVDTARGVLIEIESPAPKTPTGLHLARYTHGFGVALGFDQWRTPAVVDLEQHPTVLFVGPTRKGKTSGMKSAVFALVQGNLAEQLRFVVLSQKRYDWIAFENAKACLGVVSDPVEAIAVMEWGADRLLQQRAKRGRPGTAVLFVIDDLVNLLKRAPDIAQPMGEIASMGGGVRLFQFIGTQHAGSKAGTGGSDIEDNITARVVYKPSSASSGARSAGLGGLGLDNLSAHKGDCLFIVDGYVRRIATAHTEDSLILQLSQGNEVAAPWRAQEQPEEHAAQSEASQTRLEQPTLSLAGERHAERKTLDVAGFHAEQTVEQLKQHNLRLNAARPPTADEAAAIHALHQIFRSIHKTVLAAYGHYNGKVRLYVLNVLQDDKGAEERPNGELPATIDLATEAGRAQLAQLQVSGLITWLDPTTLLAETE